tara:strand:+ start:323 stop:667 length:345 start_codon:yes stop_codon:yes gene_type:complete
MIKYIALTSVVLLAGCLGMDEQTTDTVVATTAAGLSLLGPWGVAAGGLITTVAAAYKGYGVHKSKKQMVMDLSKDSYSKFKNMTPKEKSVLDNDVRDMVPEKYRKYYDQAKELV